MICHGDCLEVMPTLPAESIDSIVTDPPYGLSFMGKNWDHGIPGVAFWSEALRVAKPGAHLLAFGGTRTFHRLTCAIEDAGWEIRDCIMWVYGSGFPKSHNLSGDWQGWGTALKPAWEPIIVARKPLTGTVAQNVQKYGTGAINVDGCRVGIETIYHPGHKPQGSFAGNQKPDSTGSHKWNGNEPYTREGRWPANLIHDGSDEVVGLFPETASNSGMPFNRSDKTGTAAFGDFAGVPADGYYGDSGSAARFFYCAKASKADRNEGNRHPTVKPTTLMRYLCRLVTPPGGTVLDPFCGSGSTGKAATLEGFRFIGIEREAEYVEIARARIAHARGDMPLLESVS